MKIKVNAFSAEENQRLGDLLTRLRQEIDNKAIQKEIGNVRHYIIDEGVKIEGFVSHILGFLIGIPDILESKSFGYNSSSLPFNLKSQLIQDVLSPFHKYQADKIGLFMQIRNKFAHVDVIKTIEDLRIFNSEITSKLDKLYVEGKDQTLN